MKYDLSKSYPCEYKDINGNVVYTGEIPVSAVFYTSDTKSFKSENKDEK